MKKYPSIEGFRNVVRTVQLRKDYQGKDDSGNPVYKHTTPYPVLTFLGTVKLHGTNAGIVKYRDRIEYQSRERVLTLTEDNSGFMAEMQKHDLSFLFDHFEYNDSIAIYGEWCGRGIQKGIAINGLEKMFVIFGVKVDDEWVPLPLSLQQNDIRIYNILQFQTYSVEIDFNHPDQAQELLNRLTEDVENCCPVGKYFGIDGTGEGIVFQCVSDRTLIFKSKGEKHTVVRTKNLNPVNIESHESVNEFVKSVVTQNRLEQGITRFAENHLSVEPKNTGEFLRWIVTDILKEEGDTIEKNGLDEKAVKNSINLIARKWFLDQCAAF